MATDLRDLAPLTLRNHRTQRYGGDDMSSPISSFTGGDQRRIHDLYDFLRQLYLIFDAQGDCSEETTQALAAFASPEKISALLSNARQLGYESCAAKPDELLAKTVHDIRSGGLTPLIARLQLAQVSGWKIEDARAIYFLTRDHLKIMRSALPGLDDAQRGIDLSPKLHGTELLVEKWHEATLVTGERRVRLEVEAEFDGHISESCIEFGALDRILYNLINNSSRHAADDLVRLHIFALPSERSDETSETVRFVLINRLSADDRARLAGRDLRELFQPGISSTSSGLGLTVVADFVASAYGIPSRERALNEGYLGAKMEDDQFITWFHWPIARERRAGAG